MWKFFKRRGRIWQLLVLTMIFSLANLGYFMTSTILKANGYPVDQSVWSSDTQRMRKLFAVNDTKEKAQYPKDIFSVEDRRKGAVILHIIGMIYMFIALAIVCDEFFIPSLNVIIQKLNLSEDVAGATFMAAGGSAPELFTSLIGVFIAKSNVGIGTIVGSAVFNILFVIGMCAVFSKTVLALTWWPLLRDTTFYSLGLIALILFFNDGKIYWWESVILFFLYVIYVIFMKFNAAIEVYVKSKLSKINICKMKSLEAQDKSRICSIPILHSGGGRFRQGLLQLMFQTLDPVGEKDEKTNNFAIRKEHDSPSVDSTGANSIKSSEESKDSPITAISNGKICIDEKVDKSQNIPSPSPVTKDDTSNQESEVANIGSLGSHPTPDLDIITHTTTIDTGGPSTLVSKSHSSRTLDLEENEEKPLDLSWPSSAKNRITYVLLAPIMFSLWITLPDVRRPEKQKFFFISFFGCIIWIAFFSYFMVWWAIQTGKTVYLDDSIMGLTLLAAGTSIPDLITSVIVAKKGFGDMAVSSSVGSNIFDITVGLPVPWLLSSMIRGKTVIVGREGLFCSILLLLIMLLTLMCSIIGSRWRMSGIMGFLMLFFYICFLVISVLLELQIITCPL